METDPRESEAEDSERDFTATYRRTEPTEPIPNQSEPLAALPNWKIHPVYRVALDWHRTWPNQHGTVWESVPGMHIPMASDRFLESSGP